MLRRVGGRPTTEIRYERLPLALVAGLSEVIIDWLTRGMTDDVDALADQLTDFCTAVLARLES